MTSTTSRSASARAQVKSRLRSAKPEKSVNLTVRVLLVWGLLIAGMLGLAVRLVVLQVHDAPLLKSRATQQQLVPLHSRIGLYPITDRSGNLLAVDQATFTLFAHPYLFKEPAADIATVLAPILKQSPAELTQTFASAESGIPVVYGLDESASDQIRALGLDGLELIQQWQRVYPQRELTAGIVGYVDAEHRGQAGIEYSQQALLGVPGQFQSLTIDGEGFFLPDRATRQLIQDKDLTLRLTLDTRLQRAARTALQKKLKQYQALRGTTIVMDVQDGSLLALASEPSFDPETYYKADPAAFRNWAVADLYEPGSTFKPINVAIALEKKAIQANEVFYDEGQITVGGWPIQNNDFAYTGGRGPLSVTQILEYSSNVGMVHIIERLKPGVYYDFLKKLGIGESMSSDLPFGTPGQFKPREQFVDYPIEPATTSFGQGFSVTPLQMAQLHAAIANGGKLVTPHVVDGLFDQTGQQAKALEHPKPKQVFSPATAKAVQQMMGKVVEQGTGQPAKIPGYRLGGKTGTAQKAAGGTYTYSRITSFVALFPLESPRYVVLTVVDEPKGDDAFGSTVAAPVVKSVLESLITVEGIPPSHPQELQVRKSTKP